MPLAPPAALTELDAAAKFIASQLSAQVALRNIRIFPDAAERGAALPYVIYTFSPGETDRLGVGAETLTTVPLVTVQAVGPGPGYTRLSPLAQAIHAALHQAEGIIDGAFAVSAHRTGVVRYVEDADGERVNHVGAMFRVFVDRL